MTLYFLDAQTKNNKERITSFGGETDDLVKDFLVWVDERHLQPDDIWYANIYLNIKKHKNSQVYTLNLLEDGKCTITPYEKPKGFFRRLFK